MYNFTIIDVNQHANAKIACDLCSGRGVFHGDTCPKCHGIGIILMGSENASAAYVNNVCPFCAGEGRVAVTFDKGQYCDKESLLHPKGTCPVCKGLRFNRIPLPAQPCISCNKSGRTYLKGRDDYNIRRFIICKQCNGMGWMN